MTIPPYLDPRDDEPRPDEGPVPVDGVPAPPKDPNAPLDWDDATREIPEQGNVEPAADVEQPADPVPPAQDESVEQPVAAPVGGVAEPAPVVDSGPQPPIFRPVDRVPSDAEIDSILDGPDPADQPRPPSDEVPHADAPRGPIDAPVVVGEPAPATPVAAPVAQAAAPVAAADLRPHEPDLRDDDVAADVRDEPVVSRPLPTGPVTPAEEIHPVPPMPTNPGFVRHLLGFLVGLVATPIALVFAAWGGQLTLQTPSRIDANVDWFGFGLIVLAALILGAVALLGRWSPAVPITGGTIWGILLGSAYLAAPLAAWNTTASLFGSGRVPGFIQDLVTSGTSGFLLIVGVILVCSGIATALARRSGRIFGQAREVALRSRPNGG